MGFQKVGAYARISACGAFQSCGYYGTLPQEPRAQNETP